MLHLPSASGAGYQWSVHADGDTDAVRVTELDAERGGAPGESPEHRFRLSPLRPGRTTLTFEQRRAWEPDTPPRNTRVVQVVVSD